MAAKNKIKEELGLLPAWRQRRGGDEVASEKTADENAAPVNETAEVEARAAADDAAIEKMPWAELAQEVSQCRRCGLCEGRNKTVFGVGDTEAEVMFVGEGPGRDEDARGLPFVGRAGGLLDAMLAAAGLSRERGVYVANIVKCRPPQNRNPANEEAAACLPYLRRQIALVRPRLIVALGKVAAHHLLQNAASIAALRGQIHQSEYAPVIVTYHPAYLLRAPAEKRKSWEDLKRIVKFLKEESEK